jgi:hypothetical protein
MENVTKIIDDADFKKKLSEIIELYKLHRDTRGFFGYESRFFDFLISIQKITKKEIPLTGEQKDYGSILKLLSDRPDFFMGDEVSDLAYYFAYILKL